MKTKLIAIVLSLFLGGPMPLLADNELTDGQPRMLTVAASFVQDVELAEHGVLRGAVVGRDGQFVANADLKIRRGDRVMAQTRTDREGKFSVKGLPPGVYELGTVHGGSLYRVWAAGTAPPAAAKEAWVPDGKFLVRGQLGTSRRVLILGGVIVTSGVIGGVIGYNVRDFDPAS